MAIVVERQFDGPSYVLKAISVQPEEGKPSIATFWAKTPRRPFPIKESDEKMHPILCEYSQRIGCGIRICAPKKLGGSLCWGPFRRTNLLWDELVKESPKRLMSKSVPIYQMLGKWLREVHSEKRFVELPAQHKYEEELSPSWSKVILEAEKYGLSIPPKVRYQPKSFVHGEFGLSSMNYDDAITVFGWEKAGYGDPAFDVSFLLAEMLEMHCAVDGDKASAIVDLARCFCCAYYKEDAPKTTERKIIADSVARKSAIHLAMFGFFSGNWQVAIKQLLKVRSIAPEFLKAVGLGI